jgi:hypothetical protein
MENGVLTGVAGRDVRGRLVAQRLPDGRHGDHNHRARRADQARVEDDGRLVRLPLLEERSRIQRKGRWTNSAKKARSRNEVLLVNI